MLYTNNLNFCSFGRKPAILVASVVFTIGSVVMAVSPNKYVRDQIGQKYDKMINAGAASR